MSLQDGAVQRGGVGGGDGGLAEVRGERGREGGGVFLWR